MSNEEAKACAEAARMSAEDPKYDWIPGSRRPDGTFRAPIKVKKGYVPQDEMKRFETKGSQYRESQIPGFVPGMDPDDLQKKDPPKSKNQKRNENRRLKKEEGGGDEVAALADKVAAAKVDEAAAAAPAPEDPKDVLSKKIRNLKKKVRQSDELQQKVSSGELQPNDEQKEKLSSRGKLEGEIAVLEKELAAM